MSTATADQFPAETAAKGSRKKFVLGTVLLIAIAAGAWKGNAWWTEGRFLISTDDAYVQADLSIVASKLQGYVSEVPVVANQHVSKGDVLVRLDDGDYRIALEQAETALPTLERTLARIDAQIEAARATLTQTEAELAAADATVNAARITLKRVQALVDRKVTSQADLDDAEATMKTAEANRAAVLAEISGAQAQIEVLKAQRSESEVTRAGLELAVRQAKLNLDHTVLRAPFDGTVANIATELGNLVSVGARLAAVIPDQGLYVEANLKETQLHGVTPGQSVRIQIDALEDEVIEGRVTSIAPATGSIFSLLPADNATGNFTKIVQRVPVRISLPEHITGLRAGLSAVVDIDTRTGAGESGK
ncbi:HlyD family secretion protein [Donghicola mangrovi]|uniref:HlyD family secretion protein n=1 Tax=Donghicola mangrovi TaxID=2729614 RepID=A0A850QCT2_9RHOB|nr:HlyD family secretion protein [Donghicola mangrovi]NVO24748.1 HlyD family secretion protein [Donghicola mangrovi]